MEYLNLLPFWFKCYLTWLVGCFIYYWIRTRLIDKEPPFVRPRIRRWFHRLKGRLNGQ